MSSDPPSIDLQAHEPVAQSVAGRRDDSHHSAARPARPISYFLCLCLCLAGVIVIVLVLEIV
jgi:hypothetical protein